MAQVILMHMLEELLEDVYIGDGGDSVKHLLNKHSLRKTNPLLKLLKKIIKLNYFS